MYRGEILRFAQDDAIFVILSEAKDLSHKNKEFAGMAASNYLLAIDQGTTGSTALIIEINAKQEMTIVGKATVDFPQHFPKVGWVEHDLNEIWQSVRGAIQQAMTQAAERGFVAKQLAAIGITNQRETLCVFERKSGRPLHKAIVWQCKRSTDICAQLKATGAEAMVRPKTGLVIDPYFSATKITWLMQSVPEVAKQVKNGSAVFGTIDTYLLHRITNGDVYATEASNASRSMLYDFNTGTYDADLLKLFQVPSSDVLPPVQDSAGMFGKTRGLDFLPDGIPVCGILGDQQAALAGQACFEVGEAKCTYGTGAFLLMNIGSKPHFSQHGLLTTVAWQLKGERTFAFEGAAFIAGAAVQFLRDQLQLVASAPATEAVARPVRAAPDVYFVPALSGLGVPYWNPRAQGAILGLTRDTSKAQIVRATLEGMAFQVCDLISAINKDVTSGLNVLRVDGGAVANNLLLEVQAAFAGVPVERPANLETTGFGAAMMAGLGVGLFASTKDLRNVRLLDKVFNPPSGEAAAVVDECRRGWQRAIKAVEMFAAR